MIKKLSDSRDDYGPSLSPLKNNKVIILGSPSFITQITSPTPSKPLNKPTLLSPLAFMQKIITHSSSQIKPSS